MHRSDHFVIVGLTALAYNTYHELKRRGQPVVLIAPQEPPAGDFDDADVIVGDANNLEVLRKANASEAQAVLAMRVDDSENAFIVLTVKELKGKAKNTKERMVGGCARMRSSLRRPIGAVERPAARPASRSSRKWRRWQKTSTAIARPAAPTARIAVRQPSQ